MNIGRIKEIQLETAYPESVSVQQALIKVWNECEQEQLRIAAVSGRSEQLNCEHEWRVDKFDCYGFPYEKYCDKCCKKEAV